MASFDSGYFSVDAFDENSFDFTSVVVVTADPVLGFWINVNLVGFKVGSKRLDFVTAGKSPHFNSGERLGFVASAEKLHFKAKDGK